MRVPACLFAVSLLSGLVLEGAALCVVSKSPVKVPDSEWRAAALRKLEEIDKELELHEKDCLRWQRNAEAIKVGELRGARTMVRRAAFDVGSGATKMVIADVQLNTGVMNYPLEPIHSDKVNVLLTEDMERNGDSKRLSPSILNELEAVLRTFKEKAESLGVEQFAGVATAAFRKAENGPEFLRKIESELGIRLRLVTQEQESLLGWTTALRAAPDASPAELVAWDSGGGSFQISGLAEGGVDSWMAAVGSSVAKAMLVSEVQNRSFRAGPSPNPVALPQAQALAAALRRAVGAPPGWLARKVAAPGVQVVGIGGDVSMFCLASQLTASESFSRSQVLECIENMCDKTDLQLRLMEDCPAAQKQPQGVVPKLVLLYTVMELLDADLVTYRPVNGNAAGIFAMAAFWD